MAEIEITTNHTYLSYEQWFVLRYTFSDSKFTWSVRAYSNHAYERANIYGLSVNVGGNSYYKGDIHYTAYTSGSVVYSGTTNLTDCTIKNGVVTLSVTGNFEYGTWSSEARATGSGTCAVANPTVDALSYTATNKYGSNIVAGRSVITFTMKGTSQTGASTITYSLYQNSTVISTSTVNSGTTKTVAITAPSAGTYSYKYTATDSNGTSATSGTISISTVAYVAPTFTSVSAVRWTTGTSSGTASDTGQYCKAVGKWTNGKVGSTTLTATLKVSIGSSYSATTTTTGTALYLGNGALSPDDTFTVTFKLYDSYIGEANAIVRTDTLTIGGRGLDFIYQNNKYGIGVGTKAVAGNLMTAYPINGVEYGNTALPSNAKVSSVTEGLRNVYMRYKYTTSGSTSTGYKKLVRITNTGSWNNGIIQLRVSARSVFANVYVRFDGTQSNPSVNRFWADTYSTYFFVVQPSANTYDVYMAITQSYQEITLEMVRMSAYIASMVTVTPTDEAVVSSLSTYRVAESLYYRFSSLDEVVGSCVYNNTVCPIHRRRVTGTSTSGSYTISTSGWNVGRILDVRMWTTNSGNGDHALAPYYQNSTDYLNWYVPSANTSIVVRSGTSYAFGAFEMFVDYVATK